ncbi:MAG: CRISPR-associated helicase Cas3' [Candidatus Bathyarchaeia archaeon]
MIQEYYVKILEKNKWKRRKFIDYVISILENEWESKNVFIIEAPTGYGKTTISQVISLYSINEELKTIIVFPLRTLLEDQYEKFKGVISENVLGKRYMHNLDSRYLVKPITLTTIDTLSLTIFGIPPEEFEKLLKEYLNYKFGSLGHYLFSHSSIIFSNIVLDEVHLLSDITKSINFLALLIHLAIINNLKLILMSATLPSAFIKALLSFFKNRKEKLTLIKLIKFKENPDEEFIKERLKKNYKIFLHKFKDSEKFDKIFKILASSSFRKAIVIFNTVEDSINFYKFILNKELELKILLLHSRFNEVDRSEKINVLQEIKKLNEYLIISTQTIESGVDVSSNIMITELAPANSLIQRVGRFLRYENEYEGEIHIWFEIDSEGKIKSYMNKYKVYDLKIIEKTLELLKQNLTINFHVPSQYEKFLNEVYMKDDFKIDIKTIDDYKRILSNIENLSQNAFELFIKMEGSFIRDELPIPVITETEYHNMKLKLCNNVINHIIPVPMGIIKKIKPKLAVKVNKENIIEVQISDNEVEKPERLIKFMLKNDVIALIIKGEYNKDVGLTLKL